MTPDQLPPRIAAKITVDDNGCWLWTAAQMNGYGYVNIDGRMRRAHRVIYLALVGEIPEGLELDHLCRVRHCVNPDHLEPVTRRENQLRGATISARNAAVTHCPSGHEYTEENTYRTSGRRYCLACRAEYRRTA